MEILDVSVLPQVLEVDDSGFLVLNLKQPRFLPNHVKIFDVVCNEARSILVRAFRISPFARGNQVQRISRGRSCTGVTF